MASTRVLVVLAIGCILLQLTPVIQGACVCNEKGTDYCAGCSERLVVRPKQKYSNGEVDLAPIGDTCWCSKLMIEPAALPKPPCPKVRETVEWLMAVNNLLRRRVLQAAICAKSTCLNRLHKRLSNLERVESKYLPVST